MAEASFPPFGLQRFSGVHVGVDDGAATSYLADGGASSGSPAITEAQNYPAWANRKMRRLSVKCNLNPLSQDLTVAIYKNGVATLLAVTIPAGVTAIAQNQLDEVELTAGDTFDLRADSSSAGAVTATLVATLEVY